MTSETMPRMMIIDDEPIVGKRLQQSFAKLGLEVAIFTRPEEGLAAMAATPFDIVVTDLKLEGELDGMGVLARAKAINPAARVIIITGYASQETANTALREGAFEFLAKPFRLEEIKNVVLRAWEELR